MVCALVVGLTACAGWDESKQMKDLSDDEKQAICSFQYAALGGAPTNAICTAVEDGQQAPVLISQGEAADAEAECLADDSGTRWVDCRTADYVACLNAVDEAGDLCATQTAAACTAWADCVANARSGGRSGGCEVDRDCDRGQICSDARCVAEE
ncbi:MAG: hypothetical protein CMH55_04725 [Myxococcales bacterium]|nr:hypothetical protein [Myxococcales bacterium]|tara:strand:- start:87 stop:548 length:462 start_codon:yes stop_codon:yes gene_type:complete